MATSDKSDKSLEEAKASAATAGKDPVAAEISALRHDLGELAEHVRRIGVARAEGLRSAAGAKAAEGIARGEAAIEGLNTQISTVERDIVERTREKPWQALGIAAALGYLLAIVLRR